MSKYRSGLFPDYLILLKTILAGIICFIFLSGTENILAASTYFVALNGNDANTGTIDKPFRTVSKALSLSGPGDTIYLREGTYGSGDSFTITKSGVTGAPIIISGYADERPVFNGADTGPGDWNAFVWIQGNFITLRQLEFSRSNGRGIGVYGGTTSTINNVIIDDVWIHHTKEAGIFMENTDHFTVKNSRIWQTCRVNDISNENGWYIPDMWDAAIMGRNTIGSNGSGTDFKIQNNEIFESYGEGINIHGGMDNVIIEDNTVYNTWSVGIYPLNSTNVIIRRNLVYHTNNPEFLDSGNPGRGGIVLADETRPGLMSNVTVVNNLVMGYWMNFAFWNQSVYKPTTGLKNVLIADNTFVNAHANKANSIGWGFAGVWIDDSQYHINSRFMNNIILQEDTSQKIIRAPNDPNINMSNNLYSQIPDQTFIRKPTDIIGNPLLLKSGVFAAGQLKADYFTLTPLSPAISKGMNLTEINSDFFNNRRKDIPDIGAHEYQPVVTPGITQTQKPGDSNYDGMINATDIINWQKGYINNFSGLNNGDFDVNGKIDGRDYQIWSLNYAK